jgi:hypothetical protein
LQFLRRRHLNIFPKGPMLIYVLRWWPSWSQTVHECSLDGLLQSLGFCSDMKFKMAATAGLSLTILYWNKKPKLCRGPYNENSCLIWIQSDL